MLLRGLPIPAFFDWLLALHFSITGIGMYSLGRQVGAARWASLVAALGYMLGGVMRHASTRGTSPW